MNKEELRTLLNQPYQFENWKKVIDFTFPNVSYLQVPLEIPASDDLVESFKQVGTVRLSDGKNLAMFEVHTRPNVNLARNRVALRNLVAKYIDQERNHGVLAIYEKGIEDYRFTFTAKETDYDETTGNFVDKQTETKRFTYILGSNESCRTARDRFWELSQKKGKATIKDIETAFSVEKLSKEFFTKYKDHYSAFVNYLNSSYHKISAFNDNEKAIRDFVKIMLGRIVFLHFVQKKGWLGASDEKFSDGDKQFMYSLWKNSKQNESFYQTILSPLFFDALDKNHRTNSKFEFFDGQSYAIPYLGGGLFEKKQNEPNFLTFPKEYFNNLFEFFNEYNFTIDENDPYENEVGIDPEMLGHIFENLLEDNRDKGAFYTPKSVVKYMCQESLIQYFITFFEKSDLIKSTKTKIEDKLVNFVKKYEAENVIEYDHVLTKALYDVKICDPAIGSGAFPMGLLNEMTMLINVLHSASPNVVEDLWNMENWQPATVKKHIIQNSIYGVDIEKGAVDIARLRFWLSLIIDEEKPTTLPSLDYKVVVGDSLISKFENEKIDIDWKVKNEPVQGDLFGDEKEKEKYRLLKEITVKQKIFFTIENQDKETFSFDIRNLKIDLLINQLQLQLKKNGLEQIQTSVNAQVLKKQKEQFVKTQRWKYTINQLQNLKKNPNKSFSHFDWRLDFPEVLNQEIAGQNIGFDIVIGNPPYIQLQKDGGFLGELYEAMNFESYERTGDIYALFYEKGISLLKEKGVLCFITSNKWMRAGYGKSLRKYFIKKRPLKLLDLGAGIFEAATVDTNILLIQNENPVDNSVKAVTVTKKTNLLKLTDNIFTKLKDLSENSWVVLSPIEQSIKEKVERVGIPLKDWDIKINYGIKTGFNDAFIIDGETKERLIEEDPKSAEIIRPILRGRDIKRYKAEFANLWLINIHNGIKEKGLKPINIDDYPSVKNHLNHFEPKLSKRADQGETQYNLRNCAYMDDFFRPKIIYPNMTKYLPFFYDDEVHYFHNDKSFHITGDLIEYLVCFLNSSLFKFCFIDNFPELQGGTRELRKIFLDKIPVLKITTKQNAVFEKLIKEIKKCKSQNFGTKELEIEVDKNLFELYGLTVEEKNIIGFVEIL